MTRERKMLSSLIALLLVLWLGFIVHSSPRFPGSVAGGVLAISGASLMVLFSLAYAAAKRLPWLHQAISKRGAMRGIMTWHVYTGAVGAMLALLHSGHRFESNLGIALTTLMLLTSLSGYVGMHLLAQVSLELREKQDLLSKLETVYNEAVNALARNPDPLVVAAASHGFWSVLGLRRAVFAASGDLDSETSSRRAVHAAESIAEVEYSITSHQRFKRLSALWLKLHIVTALGFYILLALHIWAGIHFGLRWFQ